MLLSKKFFKKNIFTIEIEVISYCNYTCDYCENNYNNIQFYYNKCKINFNQLFIFLKKISNNFKQLILILNGGEPTLHPDLLLFCKKITQIKNIKILLYTNLSANINLYKQIQLYNNINILPTFHETHISIINFFTKLNQLNINTCIIPCTKNNILNIKYIYQILNKKNIKLILLENNLYSLAEIKNLYKYDNNILTQFLQLKISKNIQNKLCNCSKYYLYINGDGNIFSCMFLIKKIKLGNIYSLNSINFIKTNNNIYCNNQYCFYSFPKN